MIIIKRMTLLPRGWASLVMVLVLTIVSLGISLVAIGQDTEPRLTLDPSSGLPGIAGQVSGTGFDGDCGVNLFLDTTDGPSLGFASVDKGGAFIVEVIIPPDTVPGEYEVVGQGLQSRDDGSCGDPSGKEASEVFAVTEPAVDYNIYLRNRMLKDPRIDREFLEEVTGSREPVHGIVQLHSLPRPGNLEIIVDLGINLLAYLNSITAPGTAYLASISPEVASEDPRFEELIRGMQRLVADDKLDTALLLSISASPPPPGLSAC